MKFNKTLSIIERQVQHHNPFFFIGSKYMYLHLEIQKAERSIYMYMAEGSTKKAKGSTKLAESSTKNEELCCTPSFKDSWNTVVDHYINTKIYTSCISKSMDNEITVFLEKPKKLSYKS